jgi:hypothetical protein
MAGIDLLQHGDAAVFDQSVHVPNPAGGRVVDDDGHSIRRNLDVHLQGVGPLIEGQFERFKGVFRAVGRRAPVGDDDPLPRVDKRGNWEAVRGWLGA